jgi:hypothetical protein
MDPPLCPGLRHSVLRPVPETYHLQEEMKKGDDEIFVHRHLASPVGGKIGIKRKSPFWPRFFDRFRSLHTPAVSFFFPSQPMLTYIKQPNKQSCSLKANDDGSCVRNLRQRGVRLHVASDTKLSVTVCPSPVDRSILTMAFSASVGFLVVVVLPFACLST